MIVICNYNIFIVQASVKTDDKLKNSNLFPFLQLYIALPKTEYGGMSKLECLSLLCHFHPSLIFSVKVAAYRGGVSKVGS
jgi:hypothetical protein